MEDEEQHLPLLGAISACLRWSEECIVLLSGPMLMVGLGIGLVALLSDGALLVDAPWLLYTWAISQTVGVDGQLVGAWFRVSVAVSRKRWGVAIAFVLLGLLLAYVGYVAALVFATQQAYHLSTAQALARLGMDATSWLWQRAAVSVLLVCLSGYLRYRAPRKVAAVSLEERKRAIHEQMELEALKAQQRAQRVAGAVGLVRGAAHGLAQVAHGASSAPVSDAPIEANPSDVEGPAGAEEPGETERAEGEVSAALAAPLVSSDRSALPMAWITVPQPRQQNARNHNGAHRWH